MKDPNSTANRPTYPPQPSAEDVRKELNHILASPALQASEKRREFLRFIVEETLAGRSEKLKGFTIAVAVFKRDESFDAGSDAVVRVEARRLRRDLDSYYMNDGGHDAVRISIPKGSYVPHFETIEPVASQKDAGQSRASQVVESGATTAMVNRLFQWKWIFTALAILATILITYAARMQIDESQTIDSADSVIQPIVLVRAFEALGSSANSYYLAAGISQEVVTNLMRFPDLRLYASPAQPAIGANTELDDRKLAADVTYLVSGSVREDGNQVHVVSRMVFAATNRVVWTETYDILLNPNAMVQLQSELADEIATKLGQTYGHIHKDVENRRAVPVVSNMQSYLCVQSALDYRRNFAEKQFDTLSICLEKAVSIDPRYSDAWAMLGWLHLDAGRFEFNGLEQMQQEYEMALQFATKAVSLAPDSILALKALASINYYMGDFEKAEHLVRRAVALNPNEPDTLAQLGWRLAARGNFEEGIPILQRAIDRSLNPPNWYFHMIAMQLYMSGQYEEMLGVAERSAFDGSLFSEALIAIACGALNDPEGARQALENIPEDARLIRDPAGFVRRHMAVEAVVDAYVTGLEQAQLVADGS